MSSRSVSLLAFALSAAACGAETAVEQGPTSWLGASLHFAVVGTLDGEELDLALPEIEAQNTELLSCERDYIVPMVDGAPDWSRGQLEDLAITGAITRDGITRVFELELKSHDFQRDPPGTVIDIVPRDDDHRPDPTAMWLEWEWHGADGEDLLETAAETGTFILAAYEGEREENGLVIPSGEGWVGGFAFARWSETEQLRISFSAKCAESEVQMAE